jgi:hypothetical protein
MQLLSVCVYVITGARAIGVRAPIYALQVQMWGNTNRSIDKRPRSKPLSTQVTDPFNRIALSVPRRYHMFCSYDLD